MSAPLPGPDTNVGWRGIASKLIIGLGLIALAACEMPLEPTAKPRARPAGLAVKAPDPVRSEQSRALARFYGRMQADLLSQGMMRTDSGQPDATYTDTDLVRNFERIAFYDEYVRNQGLKRSNGASSRLNKWVVPVRIKIEFGASVSKNQRAVDTAMVSSYAKHLMQVTGHPISTVASNPNFHVFIMGEDDRETARARAAEIIPSLSLASLSFFSNLPRSIQCFVIAAGSESEHEYTGAIALIRAEHPRLMRQSCIHEEIAQGLGLANDSPRARPSIFNDDDEFALLTDHDEELLRLLYNPDLKPGMNADEARPIFRRLIAARSGPS